ncbi:glycosyltransferase family 1 protein [Rhizobium sp. AB2/73]|uniref:glycosyltransferase family 4 protein n=1 Tax=Rhizobium sp. AB2/73 TaxID=2795216 RepID=UPI001C5ED826|nr:glycosyltransferase family 1 protein [Rhizobium sp. AB2/73]QYA13703.1 glycosyltransferase family 4 protein [Rhizobium sp. AB2/73]UEQ80367.1 glycosyltransferase family 4 protein [Rhizobium sp. AB2/73]
MKIGVDARLLSIPLTGIGRYTHEMCNALLRAGADLRLYSPSPILFALESERGHYEAKTLSLGASRVGRMLWAETALPYWAATDNIDVFWGPTHRLPYGLPPRVFKVVTVHDLVWYFAGHTMRRLSHLTESTLMPLALKRADAVVCVSDSTQRDVLSIFPTMNASISTIYPGISKLPPSLSVSFLKKWQITKPYILFVGTLEPRKNLHRLLEAFSLLSEDLKEQHQLVLVGGKGWGDLDLAGLIDRLRLKESVKATGYVTEQELSTLYSFATCLAMPSLYEGFGLPLVEAMSRSVPVLTSNVSSMPEIAGCAGEFVDPRSVNSITTGLTSLLKDSGKLKRLGELGRKQSEKYDWDRAAYAMLDLMSYGTKR